MRTPNAIQPIQQHVQQFGQSRQPPGATMDIQEQVQDLAMEIYARLAVQHIANAWEDSQEPSSPSLVRLAKDSQTAAKAYFESMGVKFNG